MGKIQGWKQSTLSQAGKEIMIKIVAQAIPTYHMNILKFPMVVCNDIWLLVETSW